MNYLYTPIGTVAVQPLGPYFDVGNECCNGGFTNDVDSTTKVTLDYTSQLPAGVTLTNVSVSASSSNLNLITLSNGVLGLSTFSFMVSGGAAGASYLVEALATLNDGQVWTDKITVFVSDCGANVAPPLASNLAGTFLSMEPVTVTSLNTLSTLKYTPDNNVMILFVNGQAMFPVGTQPAFSVTGQTITWNPSSIYSLVPGVTSVVALYTHL